MKYSGPPRLLPLSPHENRNVLRSLCPWLNIDADFHSYRFINIDQSTVAPYPVFFFFLFLCLNFSSDVIL